MRKIKLSLFALLILLIILDFTDNSFISLSMTPFIIMLVGIQEFLSGFESYREDDKRNAKISFLLGLFVITLGIFTLIKS